MQINKAYSYTIYYKTIKKIYEIEFYVDENVLIPRQDTEILVEEVINNCSKMWKMHIKYQIYVQEAEQFGISLAKYIKMHKYYAQM